MAENNGESGGVNYALWGGIAALIVAGGAAYWYFTKDDKAKVVGTKDEKVKEANESNDVKEEKKSETSSAPAAPSTSAVEEKKSEAAHSDAKASPLRDKFDGTWNYQKKSGVWWTAKKATPAKWISLATNKAATDKLNAAYPND